MEGSFRRLVMIFIVLLVPGGASVLSGEHDGEKNVIRITASKFNYQPSRIKLRNGVPVTLELISLDRLHGFNIPALGLRADVLPGQPVRIEFMPEKIGTYPFLCDIFCGAGHDEMSGVIVVTD